MRGQAVRPADRQCTTRHPELQEGQRADTGGSRQRGERSPAPERKKRTDAGGTLQWAKATLESAFRIRDRKAWRAGTWATGGSLPGATQREVARSHQSGSGLAATLRPHNWGRERALRRTNGLVCSGCLETPHRPDALPPSKHRPHPPLGLGSRSGRHRPGHARQWNDTPRTRGFCGDARLEMQMPVARAVGRTLSLTLTLVGRGPGRGDNLHVMENAAPHRAPYCAQPRPPASPNGHPAP